MNTYQRPSYLWQIVPALVALAVVMLACALSAQGQTIVYGQVVEPQPPVWVQPAPVLVPQPPRVSAQPGVLVAYRRPTLVGQLLFGDFYVWVPLRQEHQQANTP